MMGMGDGEMNAKGQAEALIASYRAPFIVLMSSIAAATVVIYTRRRSPSVLRGPAAYEADSFLVIQDDIPICLRQVE